MSISVAGSASGRPVLVAQLPAPDRLVLWAIRAWVIGLKQRIDVAETIREAFGRHGVPEAAYLIEALMSVVACGASRTLTVESVCHKTLGDDERILLAAAALHQEGSGFEARFLLRTMLSARASSGAAEILDRFGVLLAGAGLKLFRWPPRTERYVLGPARRDEHEPAPRRPTLH
jgi:hypothetical protein